MSDSIKHECGIALVRLRKPYSYYVEKYGNPAFAINKMYLLLQKQHNRGQDGVGLASLKISVDPGVQYIDRMRSIEQQPIQDLFGKLTKKFYKTQRKLKEPELLYDPHWLQQNLPFTGEILLGHLRYGTHGENSITKVHPMLRQNNWRSRNLIVAGNFNMTNVDELFQILLKLGQHPREKTDTVTVMEKIGHFLDEENQRLFDTYKYEYTNQEITERIENELDLGRVLRRACKDFDGGYAMAGVIGNGSAFVARDPAGIRPAYYFANDEFVVVASEKPAIKTAFDIEYSQIQEVTPGHALVINKDGSYGEEQFLDLLPKKSCSFERIYFSRGNDPDIYQERKDLGKLLIPQVLEAIDYDLENTVFSYIPNTAETSFLGMMKGLDKWLIDRRMEVAAQNGKAEKPEYWYSLRPRVEKLVIKDAKLRTFITNDDDRDDLVSHVYDTTYEVIKKHVDTLVIIDDSIVRGTTLEKSILTMLNRLEPKKVIVVSSAPQIRFPDCYGIDMSRLKEFVAFRAMLALLKERGMENLLDEVADKCRSAVANNSIQPNYVKELFAPFTYDEVSAKIAEIVKPEGMEAEVQVIYQTVENLHKACPNNFGDWYFTGDYPTPGGNRVVNKAFLNFMEGKTVRAY